MKHNTREQLFKAAVMLAISAGWAQADVKPGIVPPIDELPAPGDVITRQATVLDGQLEGVDTLAFSPDGKLLASGGEDGGVVLWDVGTGKQLKELGKHEGPVLSLAFSSDGLNLASGSRDRTARVWDVKSGDLLSMLKPTGGPVIGVSFKAEDREVFTSTANGRVTYWDWKKEASIGFCHPANNPQLIEMSADGKYAVSMDRAGLHAFDSYTAKEVDSQTLTGRIHTWVFAGQSNEFAYFEVDHTPGSTAPALLHRWNIKDKKVEDTELPCFGFFNRISGDATVMLESANKGYVGVIDIATKKWTDKLMGPKACQYELAISADNRFVAATASSKVMKSINGKAAPPEIYLWDRKPPDAKSPGANK